MPSGDVDRLSPAELKDLVVRQQDLTVRHEGQIVEPQDQIAELQRLGAALRDEIARLKGAGSAETSSQIPSRVALEKATEPKSPGNADSKKRCRCSTRLRLTIDEERTVKVTAPPRSSTCDRDLRGEAVQTGGAVGTGNMDPAPNPL